MGLWGDIKKGIGNIINPPKQTPAPSAPSSNIGSTPQEKKAIADIPNRVGSGTNFNVPSANVGTTPQEKKAIADIPNRVGGGGGGGGGTGSTPLSYTTTADTGTGYNPATATNVPETTAKINNLPSVQTQYIASADTSYFKTNSPYKVPITIGSVFGATISSVKTLNPWDFSPSLDSFKNLEFTKGSAGIVNPQWRGTEFGYGMSNKNDYTPVGYQDITNLTPYQIKVNTDVSMGVDYKLAGLPAGAALQKISEGVITKYSNMNPYDESKQMTIDIQGLARKDFDVQAQDYLGKAKYGMERVESIRQQNEDVPVVIIKSGLNVGAFALGGAAFPIESAMISDIALLKTSTKPYTYFKEGSATSLLNIKEVGADLSKLNFGGKNIRIGKEIFKNDIGGMTIIDVERALPSGVAKQSVKYEMPYFFNDIKPETYIPSKTSVPSFIDVSYLSKDTSATPSFFIKRGTSETKIYDFWTDKTYTSIESFGGGSRTLQIGNIARNVKSFGGLKVSSDIPDVQTSTGSFYLMKGNEGTFKTFKSFGITREGEQFYGIASGTPSKVTFGKTTTIKGNLNLFGKIEKYQAPEVISFDGIGTSNLGTSGTSTILKTKTNPFNFMIPSITKQAGKINLMSVTKTTTIKGLPSFRGLSQSSLTQQKEIQMPTLISLSSFSTPQKQQQETITKSKINFFNVPVSVNFQGLDYKTNQGIVSTTSFKFKQPTPNQSQVSMSIPAFASPTISPRINTPTTTPDVPFIIPPFPSGDFSFSKLSRVFKGRQPKKYTPSFEAVIFNIKGKMPKGIETGARVRPITKGFSWVNTQSPFKLSTSRFSFNSKRFKMPKFNLPKMKPIRFGKKRKR